MPRAFQFNPDCPTPDNVAISGSLVSSCSLEPVPPPSFCYTLARIPIIPPPSFNFGCYQTFITGSAHYSFCLVTASLNIQIGPGPLPEHIAGNIVAAIGSSAISQAIAGCTNPTLEATVTYPNFAETGYCQPVYNLEMGIPCPKVKFLDSVANFVSPGNELKLIVKGGDQINIGTGGAISVECKKEFTVNLDVPCPSIEIESAKVHEGDSDPSMSLTATDNGTSDACIFTLSLDLWLGLSGSFTMVCDASLGAQVGSSCCPLILKKRTVYFNKGVLTDTGSCS